MIKERVDKDYNSVLRSALTSISRVNKTDVETLRASFGVSVSSQLEYFIQRFPQSLADIAQASSDQLQNLPGFGQVKVKKLKDAFERPFRNNATTTTSFTSSQVTASQRPAVANSSSLDPKSAPNPKPRPPRPASPVWDMELDLDDELPASQQAESSTRKRLTSPIWDIELDLNDSD